MKCVLAVHVVFWVRVDWFLEDVMWDGGGVYGLRFDLWCLFVFCVELLV